MLSNCEGGWLLRSWAQLHLSSRCSLYTHLIQVPLHPELIQRELTQKMGIVGRTVQQCTRASLALDMARWIDVKHA